MIVSEGSWAAMALVRTLDHPRASVMTCSLVRDSDFAMTFFVSMVSDVYEGRETLKACRNQGGFLAESLVSRRRFAFYS